MDKRFDRLKDFIDTLPGIGIPGVDCIVYEKHREVFRHSAGYADVAAKRPIEAGTLYYIYSATKIITCAAALQLYESGKFLMTDPLYEYLPEFRDAVVKKGSFVIQPVRNPIRIGNLFTMTAGLSYDLLAPEIKELAEKTEGRCPTREFSRAIAKAPLLFEPGTHWNYSFCHDVLGALIEVISGMSFGEYLRRNIFEPAGMKDTCFILPEEKKKRLATLYAYNFEQKAAKEVHIGNVFRFGPEFESGGAGLISSAEDYILFADALCNWGKAATGERILSRSTIELMRTNHLGETELNDLSVMIGRGLGYGLGVMTVMDRAAGGINARVGQFGWGGAAGAQVLIDPESELTLYYAQHMLNNMEAYTHPRIRNILYSCIS